MAPSIENAAGDCSVQCPDCSVPCADVEQHRDSVHCREPRWECEACGFLFWSRERLDKHVEALHSNRHASCSICNSSFGSKSDLNAHLRAKHRDNQMLFCIICSLPCVGILGVRSHMAEEHADEWLSCDVCTDTTSTQEPNSSKPGSDLEGQISQISQISQGRTCSSLAGQVVHFSSREALEAHVLVRHVQKGLLCQECGLVSKSREENRWHRSRAHPTAYPLPCEPCGMRFRESESLKWHVRKSPNCATKKKRKKPISSTALGEADVTVNADRTDQAKDSSKGGAHRSVDTYGCPDCPRTFGTLRAAARHSKAVHAPIRCQYCGETFGTESWKKGHERQCKVKVAIGCPFRFPEYVSP